MSTATEHVLHLCDSSDRLVHVLTALLHSVSHGERPSAVQVEEALSNAKGLQFAAHKAHAALAMFPERRQLPASETITLEASREVRAAGALSPVHSAEVRAFLEEHPEVTR